ncbi:MAG: xanthine dehydrogenase family protein molybdopterin-binding subunit [Variovorax sp.]
MMPSFPGRREDDRFLTGRGRYTADWAMPGALYAAFRRSDYAHAKILSIDTRAAAQLPGVVRVLSAADIPESLFGTIVPSVPFRDRSGCAILVPPRPILARERVRFVGEEIAVVIAESATVAADAVELVEIDYEPLSAVVGAERALAVGAPTLHRNVPGNVCFDFEYGDGAATERLLKSAAYRVHAVVNSPRVSAAPIEPRSVLAWYDAGRGTYEIRCSNQGREPMISQLAEMLKVGRERIRMHAVDVGGGFGPRSAPYPEYAILLEAARLMGRPIRWSSTRGEDLLCDSHGRGVRLEGELALDADGRFLALRTDWLCDQGAYLTAAGPVTNTINGWLLAGGGYRMQAVFGRHRLVLTNANPQSAYRGAGRPEANLILERLVDKASVVMKADPMRLRQLNALDHGSFPHTTPTGSVFDSGDYQRLLEIAALESNWTGFSARREEAASRKRLRGIGCALFVEPCGGGSLPSDQVALQFADDGCIEAFVDNTSNGQGHETTFPALIAARFGVDPATILLKSSDPDGPEIRGNASIGSRSLMAQGSALISAADEAIRKGRIIAAELLEVAVDDIEFADGRYRVGGTDLSVGFVDVVRAGADRKAVTHPLNTLHAQPSPRAFSSGVHVAEIEVEPDTGEISIVSYLAVDDIGNVVNQVLAEAQIVGGVVQALGQVFAEACSYDVESGQLLTGSFMDYAMPRAESVPPIRLISAPTPSPTNVLGAKGAGEASTTGGIATLFNAICDALRPCGVEDIAMPVTPFRIWEAIQRVGHDRNPEAKA